MRCTLLGLGPHAAEGRKPDAALLEYIHAHKTGALIRAACRMGALVGGANAEQLAALTTYAEKIGLAFQIADDVLNVTSTAKQLGKAVGSDAARRKMTYVSLYGLKSARALAVALAAVRGAGEIALRGMAGLR